LKGEKLLAKRGRKRNKKAFRIAVIVIVIIGLLAFASGLGGEGGKKSLLSNDGSGAKEVTTNRDDNGKGGSVLWNLFFGDRDSSTESTDEAAADGKYMNIYFIDVGQGDCTFIDFGETEILIDSGPTGEAAEVVSYIRPMTDGELDYVIASHPDEDHVGGMEYIFSQFDVGTIIDSGAVKNTEVYRKYIQAVGASGAKVVFDDDMKLNLGGGAVIQIIETGDDHEDTNEDSVIAKISYDKFSVLFTGDMGIETELDNINRFSAVTVLKAAHHGSSYATSAQLLKKLKPSYVVIPVGQNSYGHPSPETLSRIEKAGAKCLTTMDNGNIVISTNGKEFNVGTER